MSCTGCPLAMILVRVRVRVRVSAMFAEVYQALDYLGCRSEGG